MVPSGSHSATAMSGSSCASLSLLHTLTAASCALPRGTPSALSTSDAAMPLRIIAATARSKSLPRMSHS